MKSVSISLSSLRFMLAIWNSYSKSLTARRPRSTVLTPSCWANFTSRPENVFTCTRLSRFKAPRSSWTRSSTLNSSSFAGFFSTATISPSNIFRPRWMMLRWPFVGGSKEPGYTAIRGGIGAASCGRERARSNVFCTGRQACAQPSAWPVCGHMRNAAWLTTATLILGCAQGGPAADPLVDVAASLPPPVAPDAGPAGAGPCDPSIAAAEGTAIADAGACPGIVPAAASCAADITICSGVRPGMDGPQGDSASAATSDGRGSVVLSCHRADVGPPQDNYLFVPKTSGFISKALLGIDVRPLADGFVSSRGSVRLPPPEYDFLAHEGDLRSAQNRAML